VYSWFWREGLREKISLGRLRLKWEDNIKMDVQEVGFERGLD